MVHDALSLLCLCMAAVVTTVAATATTTVGGSAPVVYSAVPDATREFIIVPGRDARAVCYAEFEDLIDVIGWATLSIVSNATFDDSVQTAACGFIEGYVTHTRIWQNYVNMNISKTLAKEVVQFLQDNDAWIAAQAAAAPSDPYWKHIILAKEQTAAIWRGYSAVAPSSEAMTLQDFMLMALDDDIDNIEEAVVPSKALRYQTMPADELFNALSLREHCSAIVKAAPDLSDLWVAHNTWGNYRHMLRVAKVYRMPLSIAKSSGVIFSGYFGSIVSGDDLYETEGTRLAVTETTNSNLNDALRKQVTPKSVMYWQRVTMANRLAASAKDWAELFGRHNSGTYNNQWIVVDFKLFTPHKAILPNTLWVLEEAPGLVVSADQSRMLEASHWPSFNRPFYPELYELMGYPPIVAKYGDIFSYQLNPRANICRRDAGKIVTLDAMRAFIMSSAWKSDPFAYGYPGNTIAGRFDFKGGPSTGSRYDSWFRLGLHGARDGKVLSAAKSMTGMSMDAINGPPYNADCPPFEWTGQWANVTHLGMPTKFQFNWVSFSVTPSGSIIH